MSDHLKGTRLHSWTMLVDNGTCTYRLKEPIFDRLHYKSDRYLTLIVQLLWNRLWQLRQKTERPRRKQKTRKHTQKSNANFFYKKNKKSDRVIYWATKWLFKYTDVSVIKDSPFRTDEKWSKITDWFYTCSVTSVTLNFALWDWNKVNLIANQV